MAQFLYQPPVPDRKIKSMRSRGAERSSDRTTEHALKGWVPVNPAVLKLVREKVKSGKYRPEEILDAVKQDPGTVFHITKTLHQMGAEGETGLDPLEALATLEKEKLERIFSYSESEISAHRLWNATPAQISQAKYAVISSRAAEALAESTEFSGSDAYSAAMLRQLGHELIAWNYPDLYSRALAQKRQKGILLDQQMLNLLGLTPIQLGAKIAAAWNVKRELRWAFSLPKRGQEAPLAALVSDASPETKLRTIVGTAELFAAANDPEQFPEEAEHWAQAEKELTRNLGISLQRIIRPRIDDAFRLLEQSAHRPVSSVVFARETERVPLTGRGKERFERNIHLRRCHEGVKDAFAEVYSHLLPSGVSVDAIRVLVNRVIPDLGFERGCLYLLSKDGSKLVPHLRIGDQPLSSYPVLKDFQTHPVAASLTSPVPLVRTAALPNGNAESTMYGSLGSDRHPGVLQLVVKPSQVENPAFPGTHYFQAVRAALVDAIE